MIDAVDDAYLVLYSKGGKDHDHPNECQLFVPDTPIPRYIKALQKAVLDVSWLASQPINM